MRATALIAGIFLLMSVMLDAFQTIILPRRPTGRVRLTKIFFLVSWGPWKAVARRITDKKRREQWFSIFGPLTLILLLGVWAVLLVMSFGLIFYALGSPFSDAMRGAPISELAKLGTDLYVSGTTLFTLGLGDVLPRSLPTRVVVIVESALGLGFVAIVVGYLPVLYQAFSRREVSVAMLDGRAGSPPTATELLRRHAFDGGQEALIALLAEWERWSAEILESHISYPILCYYRSQHDNQSWLSAMVAILDACALLIALIEGKPARQAQLTFAMARHALIDLGHVFRTDKRLPEAAMKNRLPPEEFNKLCDTLGDFGIRLCGDPASAQRLHAMRGLYEAHAMVLAEYMQLEMPTWIAAPHATDQWRRVEDLRRQAELVLRETGGGGARAALLEAHDDEHQH